MKYFIHLITKMAKILQPTILFIDGAHKPFIKKVIPQSTAIITNKLAFKTNTE